MKAILAILSIAFFSSCLNDNGDIPKIKNVVVILSDDHARNVSGVFGNDIIRTPSIDKLAEQGITFNNSYCNAPICSASRQSLLTGKYPHATGVNLLFTPFPDEGNTTIAEYLQTNNYKTALIGKSHFNNWIHYDLYKNGLPKHGFDTLIQSSEYLKFLESNKSEKSIVPENLEYYQKLDKKNVAEWMNSRVLPHPVYDENSIGTFYANEAIRFIKENKDRPFFLWLAFHEPHHPYYFPIKFAGRYNPEDMQLPEGSPEDDRWIPAKYKNLTDAEKKGIIAAYYTSTEYMDKNIGMVTSALQEMSISEETIVIYISDNGYLLNDHKRFEKHTMWQEAVKQPMIINFNGQYNPGSSSDAIIEYIDILPTITDILGLSPLNEVQGKSFMNVISGEKEEFKDHAFAEYLEDNLAMVTTKKWKYIFHTGRRDLGIGYATGLGPAGITHFLYNLIGDPNETTNLAQKPEHQNLH